MASETVQETAKVVAPENNDKKPKEGLAVFGYIVPWWVVILVVLLILFYAHDKGYLNGVLGEAGASAPVEPKMEEIKLAGPLVPVAQEPTPEGVAALARMFNVRSRF